MALLFLTELSISYSMYQSSKPHQHRITFSCCRALHNFDTAFNVDKMYFYLPAQSTQQQTSTCAGRADRATLATDTFIKNIALVVNALTYTLASREHSDDKHSGTSQFCTNSRLGLRRSLNMSSLKNVAQPRKHSKYYKIHQQSVCGCSNQSHLYKQHM